MEIFIEIFELCIIPLLGILTAYAVDYLRAKKRNVNVNTDDALKNKYINMLLETVATCVTATNQTYVESLKQQGKFDANAQAIAFEQTYKEVLKLLTDEAKVYLSNLYGDLSLYITQKIESEVNSQKKKG